MSNTTTKPRNGKTARSKRGMGRLYKRGKDGKEYRASDPHGGNYYLEQRINGKRVRTKLTDEHGKPITKLDQAKAARDKLIAPLLAGEKITQLNAVRSAIEEVEQSSADKIRIGDIWEACKTDHKTKRRKSGGACSERTLSGYRSQVEAFEKWMKREHPQTVLMADVNSRLAEEYAAYLTEENYSPSTFNQHIKTLAFTWRALRQRAGLPGNPFQWDKETLAGIAPSSVESERRMRRKAPLTIDQVNAAMEATTATDKEGKPLFSPEYHTLFAILSTTGQRLIDCVLLKWEAVDFNRKVITVTPAKTRRYGKTLFIPLLPELETELGGRIQSGEYIQPELAALYRRDNAAIAKTLRRIFKKAEIKLARDTDRETARAVANTGAHGFRHAFVTLARMHGINDAVIAGITGHSTLRQMDNYDHTMTAENIAALSTAIAPKNLLAEPEVKEDPLPPWAKELAERLDGENWEEIKAGLLANA